LRIELTPENTPVAFNDYLHTERRPIHAPLAANVGCGIEPFNDFVRFSFGRHLANERIQAEYQVRIAVTMFAHGVEKIFFHAGTGSAINHGNHCRKGGLS
jgi:hypothetical protein